MKIKFTLFFVAGSALSTWASGQNSIDPLTSSSADSWSQCKAITDDVARLRCFDAWATQQGGGQDMRSHATPQGHSLEVTTATMVSEPSPPSASAPVIITMTAPEAHNCKNPRFSELSRFWELEAGSDCGTFGIRGYKPISLSVLGSDSVNTQPDSSLPDHRATSITAFNTTETRIQLSVRTKVAQGLLTQNQLLKRDSLWFGYTQQSNWQIFSGDLSRPFRTTDHEPEVMYIYPVDLDLPGGWRMRYAGLALNHQSNGQPLPLSRSWNRNILMTGLENGSNWRLTGKLWYRLPENSNDDDNPEISDLIGRGELTGVWTPSATNTFALTVRHSLRAQANGSVKLEWLHTLNDTDGSGKPGGLQLHTQLFSGYGDSLIDYNRRRTVLSVGLSLVDW
ncbi:MAG: phospholipase A [Rhodoferax sp.]|nr:phospholipase A [Rhodoferax sp.]